MVCWVEGLLVDQTYRDISMRQFSRPQKLEEQIPEILPAERQTPLVSVVEQSEVANPNSEYAEVYNDLLSEIDAWDSLLDSVVPYVKTALRYTSTITITPAVLAAALSNEDPRYPDYTEEWQTHAYQEGLFHDMISQVVIDVCQELKNSLESWNLVVAPEVKAGEAIDKTPGQAAEATKNTVQATTAKAETLRDRINSELGEVGKKVNRCMVENLFQSMNKSSVFAPEPLAKLSKLASGLRNFMRVSVLLRTPPYTKQWRSLSDLVGYTGTKALINTASPMVHKLEDRLCSPIYDIIEELNSASSEKYCGALDEMINDIVTDLEHVKSRAVSLQSDILRQLEERYKNRESIVDSAAGRLKVSKIEVAIDKILEMVQRANLISEAETAMQEWLEVHYPKQKLEATK